MISLSEDIAVRTLKSGMLRGVPDEEIKSKISMFLTPERTKSHGRPIYADEASACGLSVEKVPVTGKLWQTVYRLYIRADNFVKTNASKCIESKSHSFSAGVPRKVG